MPTPTIPNPDAERWHAHPYAVAAGQVAAGVVLVVAILVGVAVRWRARRVERDLLRKYPHRDQRSE
jgi:hypothetical protein